MSEHSLEEMEHLVTYVERCVVRFIQDTFIRNTEKAGMVRISRQGQASSFLEYDLESRPIEMTASHKRERRNILYNSNAGPESSSDGDFSSTEEFHSVGPRTRRRRRRTFQKRQNIPRDELLFGIDI